MNIKTSKQFRDARRKLGLSTSEAGAILNTEERTIRKWEQKEGTNARDPNPIACRVMEWMLEGYRPPQFPKRGEAERS